MHNDLIADLLDWVRGRYFGKYRGTVEDNNDSTARGRLKVKVPAVLGQLQVWAMPCVPYAGDQVGFYSLPEQGTGVWVEFEGGDPSYPIWTGFYWADNEIPDDKKAAIKIWRTKAMKLRIDDDKEEIVVESTKSGKVTIADKVVGERGNAKLTIDSKGVAGEAGSQKTELTSGSFKVNGGAFEVS
jgi:uncharacterized protein involved in type VI secretion and phage assembly